MVRLSILVLISLFTPTHAVVELTYSQLLDHEDFSGSDKIELTKCNHSCLVYAAAPTSGDVRYQNDIILVRKVNGGPDQTISNLYDISRLRSDDDPYLRKGITLDDGFRYVFVHRASTSNPIGALAIYVVSSDIPNLPFPTHVPVYDAPADGVLPSKLVLNRQSFTVLSTSTNTIIRLSIEQGKNFTVRMTGYDAIIDDRCKPLYPTYTSESPLLTMSWDSAQNYGVRRGVEKSSSERISIGAGDVFFLTSSGFIGCAKVGNFRSLTDDNEPNTVTFEVKEHTHVLTTVVHGLLHEDTLTLMTSDGNQTYSSNQRNAREYHTRYLVGPTINVTWSVSDPRSQWAVILQPFTPPTAPTMSPRPDASTKSVSTISVMTLALVTMLGAALPLH